MAHSARLAIIISIVGLAVRFVLIDQPYIDEWSWRQSDVAAIARNFFQGGFHFSRPQIDWAGDQPGYVGTEFPVLPFLAALCYRSVGVHEWVGRIQAVVLFAVSLPFIFLIVRRIYGETAALWALFFYNFAPLGIMASRCFMPDIPTLTLSIVGLYLFQRWIEEDDAAWSFSFFAGALCISLSILIKATSVLIAAPLACLAFQHFRFSAFRRFKLWLFAAIALIPAAVWYGYAYHIAQQFYPHHFFGAGGVRIMPLSWDFKIGRLVVTSTLTPVLFVAAAFGGFVFRHNARGRLFYYWLAAMLLFMIVVGYGNRHQWYQLPLLPIAAAFGGAACAFVAERISQRSIKIVLVIALVSLFLFPSATCVRRFYRPLSASLRTAGLELKQTTPPNALLVAADNGDPTIFYYAERKGWHFLEKDGIYDGEPQDSERPIADLEQLRKKGARYLIFSADTSWWLGYYLKLREHLDAIAISKEVAPSYVIYQLRSSE